MHSIFTLVLLWSFCTFDAAVGFRAYRRALSARCRKYSKQAWTNPDLYEQRYPAQSVCRRINIAPVGILPSLSSFRAGIGALSAVSSSSTDPARSPYIGAAVETAKARVEHMLRKHQSENGEIGIVTLWLLVTFTHLISLYNRSVAAAYESHGGSL